MREIPEGRKNRLDSMFEAFSIVAEGTYVFLCDMEYDYSRWSRSAVSAFGLPGEYMHAAGDIWEEHIHPEDRDAYHAGIAAIFSGSASGHDMQYRAKRTNGKYDVCTCRGVVIRDGDGTPLYFGGAIRNHGIQGHIDTLTGLRNQYGFFEDLRNNLSRSTEIRICMVGIGKFTEVNEVYGYRFGNRILQRFGRVLFEYVGNSGDVYRLDGTKFAIISSTLSSREIRELYEAARTYFRKGFSVEDKLIILELSAGMLSIDNFEIDDQTAYGCLKFAYDRSKIRNQGDLIEFYNDLSENNKQRLEKLFAIRGSIMHGYEGFYLMYQPVMDAHNEKLSGAEALLRWRNDEYGMVPPDNFIPLLERDPLFPSLGRWILRRALLDAKRVLKSYPDFIVNINLAYTQLERTDFLDMVKDTLRQVDFPPERLCLEITERCRLLDVELLKNIVVHLRSMGIRIALDDFGTGFSSIGLIKNLPFDTIKIDKSFVLRIEADEKERRLMEHFTSMAATFGAQICVEGVETAGMRDILQKYHVKSFQGFYYTEPLEIDGFLQWSGSAS